MHLNTYSYCGLNVLPSFCFLHYAIGDCLSWHEAEGRLLCFLQRYERGEASSREAAINKGTISAALTKDRKRITEEHN